jgi:hypothetical protein
MNIYKTISLLIVYFFLSGGDIAYAYLDPGSGGFIIQMVVAFIASLIIFFKTWVVYCINFFFKFLNLLKKKFKKKQ